MAKRTTFIMASVTALSLSFVMVSSAEAGFFGSVYKSVKKEAKTATLTVLKDQKKLVKSYLPKRDTTKPKLSFGEKAGNLISTGIRKGEDAAIKAASKKVTQVTNDFSRSWIEYSKQQQLR